MRYEFHVKELGLVLNDGRMAMPGSVIVLTAPAPAHWSRFGSTSTQARTLEVATPAPAQQPAEETDTGLDALRAEYEDVTGKQADKRWKAERLAEEINKALEE